jgi:hypothetical protein
MRRSLVPVALLAAALPFASPARAQPVPDPDDPAQAPGPDEYADTDPSALTEFAPALDPYGTWVVDPTYGTVWTPGADQVDATFQPYVSGGSWSYADGDYAWVSDYAWGWACFHYGRWANSAGRWVWIPGRRYAAAWVSWRLGDDGTSAIGWAPLAPTWFWISGSALALSFVASEPWAFTTVGDFSQPNVGAHLITGSAAAAVASHTHAYVAAKPSVTTGAASTATPHAPPPAMLGLDVSHVASLALSVQESRARQLARPSTAVALGARAPARHVARPASRPYVAPRGLVGATAEPARGRR